MELQRRAEQGHADAQFNLGVLYSWGVGVAEDDAEAVKWFRKAADQGHAGAQFNLGFMYANGEGVAEDDVEAVKWWRRAAEQGLAKAQFNLGLMYGAGLGVTKDDTEAAKWFRRAAEQGLAEAQSFLGRALAYGQGLPQDDEEAVTWYRKAAEQGLAEAQYYLGVSCAEGRGVPQDAAEATRWWRKAAEQGLAQAQYNLGVAYVNGQGVMQSDSAAVDWLYRAARSFLKDEKREDALRCYDVMKGIAPDHFLVRRILAEIYSKQAAAAPGAQADVVFATAWPTPSGYLVTNYHVVAGSSRIVLVRPDGVQIAAEVVSRDAGNDLALLKAADVTLLPKALPLAPENPQVGEPVFTVGYPHPDLMGHDPKVTEGIVNSLTGLGGDTRTMQISTALQAGNSGGPVMNMAGEVVGIAVGKLDAVQVFEWTGDLPENVGYAVQVAYLKALLSLAPPSNVELQTSAPIRDASLATLAGRVQPSVLLVKAYR